MRKIFLIDRTYAVQYRLEHDGTETKEDRNFDMYVSKCLQSKLQIIIRKIKLYFMYHLRYFTLPAQGQRKNG